jgi:hypothetical protein
MSDEASAVPLPPKTYEVTFDIAVPGHLGRDAATRLIIGRGGLDDWAEARDAEIGVMTIEPKRVVS